MKLDRFMMCAALVVVAIVLGTAESRAFPPDPSTTTTSNGTPGALNDVIAVSGHMTTGMNSGQPDICGASEVPTIRCNPFTVTVRDFANNVVPGARVEIDFSECSDIMIACDQLESVTGQHYEDVKRVVGVTNVNGNFTFRVQGAANSTTLQSGVTSAGTTAGVTCAKILLDGALVKTLRVVAYDLNGGNGIAGTDTVNGVDTATSGREVANCLSAPSTCKERTDTNMNGTVSGADTARQGPMSIDVSVFGTGAEKTGSYCP